MEKTVLETYEEMNSISLEGLENPIHREFVNDTLIAARQCEAIVQDMPEQLHALETAYAEEMQASLVDEQYQSLTQEVDELADARSKTQTALKSGFRAMMGVGDEAIVQASAILFNLMHKYDLHTGMNVDKQTGIIDSFIADVEAHYAEQLRLSTMTELFNYLKISNQRVCDKVIERDQSRVGKGTNLVRNARNATDKAWRELRRAVNAYAYVKGYTVYEAFIGYMNVLIIRYKRVHLDRPTSSPEAVPGEGTEGSQTPTKYKLEFIHNGQTVSTAQLEAGAAITAPAAPSGYHWVNVPSVMPAQNLTIHSAEDEEEEPPILS